MSVYNHRLRRLEPRPGLDGRREEVALRLTRYAIEWRHVTFAQGRAVNPEKWEPGGIEFERMYERLKSHPGFDEICSDVASGNLVYCRSMGRAARLPERQS